MATSLGYLYSLLVTLANFDPVSFSAHQSKPEANRKALFVFGDSLFDAGNNQYLNTSVEGSAVIWPYGETYFNHPTGRISDGRIVPDFIEREGIQGGATGKRKHGRKENVTSGHDDSSNDYSGISAR